MKALNFVLILVLISSINSTAQDYKKVDNVVDKYPHGFASPQKLSDQIKKDFNSDIDKARAVYRWMAKNVKYDVNAFLSPQKGYTYSYSTPEEKKAKELQHAIDFAGQTLKKKKAVCEGYANLFKVLCDLLGVECEIVSGYSKTMEKDIGKSPKSADHSWNAVKIKGKWQLLDATWGAGYVDFSKKVFIPQYTDFYFLTPTDQFFLKHFPENQDWLLTDKSLQDFIDLPLYYSDEALSQLEIIKPEKGIISVKSKTSLEFKWKTSLDAKQITFAFRGSKYSSPIETTIKGGTLSFEIAPENIKSEILTFYYNGTALITYKVDKK